MCFDCIKLNVDISDGIQREATIHFCRGCDRWLQPPSHWVRAAPESRELLALCLRKLRGLSKVRIVDASFIWTEPHSKRIKVKITVQQEAGILFPAKAGDAGELIDMDRLSRAQLCNRLSRLSTWWPITSAQIVQSHLQVSMRYFNGGSLLEYD